MLKPMSFLFFVVLILALWPRRIISSGVDIIDKACEKTRYKDVCKSSLKDDCESEGSDLHNLARIAVKLAWINATDTQEHIKKLLGTAEEPFMEQCLMDCDATYDDAIGNLENSESAFETKGYDDVLEWVAATMIDPQTCEGYFKDVPGHTSPLTSRNEALVWLCDNALALTKLVADGSGKEL